MTQPTPPSLTRAPRPGPAGRDLLVVAGLSVAAFALSVVLEVREWLTEATRPLEAWQLDELPLTFAVLALSLAWFSWRRWREAARELRLREQADAHLAEREERFRMLFMEDLAGNALASEAGEIRLCNPAMARVLGFAQPEQATGHDIAQFYADRALWVQHRAALQRGEKVEAADLELVSRDGARVHAIARMWPWYSPGRGREVHISLADVSEVRFMQSELAEALAEHRRLAQQYVLVQEEERRSLARELHDEMGQCLNAIKLDAVSIRAMARGRDAEVEASANAIVELSGHVYDVVRGIMQRLRPAALDALGLRDALAGLVGQWSRRNPAVRVHFEATGALEGLGEAINITAYRLVQECLTNVIKHAQATQVAVSVQRTAEGLQLSVSDDGRGMDLQGRRGGLGLLGLRERVEALAGRVELQSAPAQGMLVRAVIPVAAGADVEGMVESKE
jgi:PAS domain S-box-containing protein